MSQTENHPPSPPPPGGWQPFTFAGVAGLALAPRWRLQLVQTVMAIVSTVCVVWFLKLACVDAIREAIHQLPATGDIHHGRLAWTGPPPTVLVRHLLLSIVVDMDGDGNAGQLTDWQLELRQNGVRFRSILGYVDAPYPPRLTLVLDRDELEPWWGAWEPGILAAAAALSLLGLLLTWALLGAVYAPFVRLYAFLIDRRANLGVCWRLGRAALMPGAFLFDAALVFYGLKQLEFIGLLFAFALHLALAWPYLLMAPSHLPSFRPTWRATDNPFAKKPAKE